MEGRDRSRTLVWAGLRRKIAIDTCPGYLVHQICCYLLLINHLPEQGYRHRCAWWRFEQARDVEVK